MGALVVSVGVLTVTMAVGVAAPHAPRIMEIKITRVRTRSVFFIVPSFSDPVNSNRQRLHDCADRNRMPT